MVVLGRSSEMANEELAVGKDDLVNLWRLVEGRDGGPAWIKMMEKSLPTMTYQAWRRDAQVSGFSWAFLLQISSAVCLSVCSINSHVAIEFLFGWNQNGPPQYQSSSIFEDANPEEVRDFFGDDEFRMSNKWDDMLIYHKTLEECQTTGMMKVHWVRKVSGSEIVNLLCDLSDFMFISLCLDLLLFLLQFPFFCSDREYIIARRIWKLGGAYYCVTKVK